ncbi:MAG: hypothetical protein ABJ050_17445 [Paracoccaceae bacterium]
MIGGKKAPFFARSEGSKDGADGGLSPHGQKVERIFTTSKPSPICQDIGYPKTIRVDQGSEFISRDLDLWAYANDVMT